MDILWLTPDKPDNISVGRQRIASRLRQAGHAVTVRGTTPGTVRQSIGERGRYDAVVGVTRSGAFAGVAVAGLHRIPLVVDHIDPISQFAETERRWLTPFVRVGENVSFRIASHVMYVYEEEETRVRRYSPDATKTALGVDYDRIANPSDRIERRAEALLADYDLRENVAIYVGGLEPLYNLEPLLTSLDSLADWSLVIAGAGTLEDTVRRSADGERIAFLGTVDHELVPGLLHAADVGVSLVDDPHTLKVLEYGAAGLPVLQLAGRAEHRFEDRVTYCEADPESIAEGIRTASERSGEQLHDYVSQFDWGRIAQSYEQVLTATVQAASQS